jgi:hypothetical protein
VVRLLSRSDVVQFIQRQFRQEANLCSQSPKGDCTDPALLRRDQRGIVAYLPDLTQSQSPPSDMRSGFFTTKRSTVSGAKHSR